MNPVAVNGMMKAAEAGAAISPFGPLNTGLISIMIGLLIYAMKSQIANRKLTIQVNGEMRQEWIDEMAVIRGELRGARDENEQLRDDIRTLRTEVRKKDDKIDQLRDEVRGLHGVIDGMRRENLTGQLTAQRMVADMLPQTPEIERAMKSLGNIQGDVK